MSAPSIKATCTANRNPCFMEAAFAFEAASEFSSSSSQTSLPGWNFWDRLLGVICHLARTQFMTPQKGSGPPQADGRSGPAASRPVLRSLTERPGLVRGRSGSSARALARHRSWRGSRGSRRWGDLPPPAPRCQTRPDMTRSARPKTRHVDDQVGSVWD